MPGLKSGQVNIHDAYPLELGHLIAQVFAHASNLTIKPLGEDNAESSFVYLIYLARLGDGAQNRHALAHALQETGVDGLVNGYNVLLLVLVTSAEDFVDDISVVGQEDESLRGLVQPANRKKPLGVIDEINDVLAFARIGGANYPCGLIKSQVEGGRFSLQRFAFEQYLISGKDPVSLLRNRTIDLYQSFFNKAVGFAARADARTTDVLIETNRIVIGFVQV